MLPKRMRIERKDTGGTRLYALLFTVLPIACALGLLWWGLFVGKLGALVCVAIAVQGVRANLRFSTCLELVGARVVVHPLWSSRVQIHDELCELTARLAFVRGAEPPTLAGDYYTLRFPDGEVLVQPSAFPGADDFVESLLEASCGDITCPLRLGDAALEQWVRFPNEPSLGVTAGYRHADGTLVAICGYPGERADRADAAGVERDFARTLRDLRTLYAKKRVVVELMEQGTASLAGVEFLSATVALRKGSKVSRIQLLLAAWDGRMLKLRVSDAPGNQGSAAVVEATLEAFLVANRGRA